MACRTPLSRSNVLALESPNSLMRVPMKAPSGIIREHRMQVRITRFVCHLLRTNSRPRLKPMTISWHMTAMKRFQTLCVECWRPMLIPSKMRCRDRATSNIKERVLVLSCRISASAWWEWPTPPFSWPDIMWMSSSTQVWIFTSTGSSQQSPVPRSGQSSVATSASGLGSGIEGFTLSPFTLTYGWLNFMHACLDSSSLLLLWLHITTNFSINITRKNPTAINKSATGYWIL